MRRLRRARRRPRAGHRPRDARRAWRGGSASRALRASRATGSALPEVPVPPELDLDVHTVCARSRRLRTRVADQVAGTRRRRWMARAGCWDGCWRQRNPARFRSRKPAIEELAAKREWREALAIEGQLTDASAPAELGRFSSGPSRTAGGAAAPCSAIAPALPSHRARLRRSCRGADWPSPGSGSKTDRWCAGSRSGRRHGRCLRDDRHRAVVRVRACQHRAFDRAALGERAMRRYAAMLALVCHESWTRGGAREAAGRRCAQGGEAPDVLSRLARLVGVVRASTRLAHGPLSDSGADVVGLPRATSLSIAGARATAGTCAGGSTRWVRMDALATLAMVGADQPAWTSPRVEPGVDATAGDGAWPSAPAPTIAASSNDVEVGPRRTLLLITGSNMSGKSTLLRAIGLNTVLAQAGAPVCATAFEMPPANLHTSIRVEDSLELGLSYFMAALARLKQIVDAAIDSRTPAQSDARASLPARRSAPGHQQRRARDRRPRRGAPPARRAGHRRDDDPRSGAWPTRSRSSPPHGSRISPSRSTLTAR